MTANASNQFAMPKFTWFTGKVEDIFDPLEANRVRVRCIGYHSDNKDVLPTTSLPWSLVMLPATDSGAAGNGRTPHGLTNNSVVVGFFLDGETAQQPLVIGTVPGKTEQEEGSENDGIDVSKVARGDNKSFSNTLVSSDGISEPQSAYKPKYPYNKVEETTSGHLVEYDDTPGNERIHVRHKSGSFTEHHPDGTVVYKSIKDNYEFTLGNEYQYVQGNVNIVVNGNVSQIIKGSLKQKITGNWQVECAGWSVKTNGSANFNIGGSANWTAGGQYKIKGTMISLN